MAEDVYLGRQRKASEMFLPCLLGSRGKLLSVTIQNEVQTKINHISLKDMEDLVTCIQSFEATVATLLWRKQKNLKHD